MRNIFNLPKSEKIVFDRQRKENEKKMKRPVTHVTSWRVRVCVNILREEIVCEHLPITILYEREGERVRKRKKRRGISSWTCVAGDDLNFLSTLDFVGPFSVRRCSKKRSNEQCETPMWCGVHGG